MSVSQGSPLISIIMPTYNRGGYIRDTIDSILRQSYVNWELIIIDDGSDDNTAELVKAIKDERIRFYKAGRIGIISQVRKMGIEKAAGEFFAFIDSDDLWAPTKLEKQVDALNEYPDAGFCLTGGYNFMMPGVPIDFFYKKKTGIEYGNLYISFFRSKVAGYTQALMFRKECMTVSEPFKEADSDVDFISRLALNFNGVILYEALVFRRIHQTNYSNANWKKSYYKGIRLIQANRKHLASKIERDALFSLYINFGEDCLKYKEPKLAIQNFLKAWKYNPFSIIPLKKSGKVMLRYFKR